jgi:type II secretory pathway component GspD/PulD (secretin)
MSPAAFVGRGCHRRSLTGLWAALCSGILLGPSTWADDSSKQVIAESPVIAPSVEQPSAAMPIAAPNSIPESPVATSTETVVPAIVPVVPPIDESGSGSSVSSDVQGELRFRFAFSGAPWREVLNWLAEESGLALHVGALPVGSFTYSDPEAFTVDQAISRVNLFLIPQGYALVKRGQLLSVISLADPRSLQQLDALATPTTSEELVNRSEHEIVKCMLPLGELVAAEAVAELQPLMLMTTPVILPKSNQMIVTETAGKVRSVLAVLQALRVPRTQSVVRRFDLQSVDVAAVMAVAGPHIGLTAGQTEGLDISISADASGKTLFVTGVADKVERLESLIAVLDVKAEMPDTPADTTLRSHTVTGDNLQAVYDVLQTILAGKSMRLSMQPSTKSIVALADAESHLVIENTIKEMQAPAIDFAVVELNALDPYFVLSLIEEMFAAPTSARDRDRDSEVVQPAAPKVDADPGNRRLFVRGTTEQINQIKQMVTNLTPGKTGRSISTDSVRVLPLKGHQRQRVLEAASRIWQGDNRVLILPSSDAIDDANRPIERVIHPQGPGDRPVSIPDKLAPGKSELFEDEEVSRSQRDADNEALVSLAAESANLQVNSTSTIAKPTSVAPIRGQLVPQGILLQSEDTAALDLFEEQLMEIAASNNRTPSPPVVYYLRYVNAEDAVKMLADLLDGGQSLAEAPENTLINGNAFSLGGSSYYGSLTTKKEGVTTVTAGTATIVSDARLNRLIVQGTTEDVAIIDEYMQIVDKGSSITTIETFGQSHVIELQYTKAKDVAEMIEQAFVNRIAKAPQANPQQGRPGERPGGEQRQGGDGNERRDGGEQPRDVADKPTRGRLPEMTVAAHEASNSLVITAPDALFEEVERLVQSIDTMSEQVTEVIPAKDGVDLETILRRLNGEDVRSSREKRRSSDDDSRGNSDRSRSR